MDYEKLHKDTIAKLQEMVNSGKITVEIARGICADFIPESEDERIRKELIAEVKEQIDCIPAPDCRDKEDEKALKQLNKWLAWLKKHGEQKPVDETKFKIEKGKWYVGIKTLSLRGKLLIKENNIYYAREDGAVIGENKSLFIDKHDGNALEFLKLWTIKDAKAGDVLLSPSTPAGDKECPFIFKEIDENGVVRCHVALLQSENLKIDDGITNVMGYADAGYDIPATKEQRDLLFQKIHEAGYEWDAEKKELKKIEQNPAWSEEDESMLQNILECLKNGWRKLPTDILKYESWLKSIKNRI